VTGIAASTAGRGLKDLRDLEDSAAPASQAPGRVRRPGGGRKPLTETDGRWLDDLIAPVEPDARGDPMSPPRWTCKSLRRLAAEPKNLGHQISHTVVGELLKEQKFSLQASRKTKEGADDPDRDAQVRFHQRRGQNRAVPCGVYDLAANTGWANVGIDDDTAAFAVGTIRC
jgi:hypothetical protein